MTPAAPVLVAGRSQSRGVLAPTGPFDPLTTTYARGSLAAQHGGGDDPLIYNGSASFSFDEPATVGVDFAALNWIRLMGGFESMGLTISSNFGSTISKTFTLLAEVTAFFETAQFRGTAPEDFRENVTIS